MAKKTYTVQGGDSFAKLAEKFYGDQRFLADLMAANGNIKILRPGDTIRVPNLDTSRTPIITDADIARINYYDSLVGFQGKDGPLLESAPLAAKIRSGQGFGTQENTVAPPNITQPGQGAAQQYPPGAYIPGQGIVNPQQITPATNIPGVTPLPPELQPQPGTGSRTGEVPRGRPGVQRITPETSIPGVTPLPGQAPQAGNYGAGGLNPGYVPFATPPLLPGGGQPNAAGRRAGSAPSPRPTFQTDAYTQAQNMRPGAQQAGLIEQGLYPNQPTGTKPPSYLTFNTVAGNVNPEVPGQYKVIGGGEGYADLLPGNPPKLTGEGITPRAAGGGVTYRTPEVRTRGRNGGGPPPPRYRPPSRYAPPSADNAFSFQRASDPYSPGYAPRYPNANRPAMIGLVNWRI